MTSNLRFDNSASISSKNGNIKVRCNGPLLYKGKPFNQALDLLCKDEAKGTLDTREFAGSFLVEIENKENIKLITDCEGVMPVFFDSETKEWSSSLESIVRSRKGKKLKINRQALLEQLATGAVSGKDTLFHGIERLGSRTTWKKEGKNYLFMKAEAPKYHVLEKKYRNLKECASSQLEILENYFSLIKRLSKPRGVCLGLSGGYDSRLMLLLALKAGMKIKAYTFSSKAHDKDSSIAGEIARIAGVELVAVPVRTMEKLGREELEENIDDALKYYDGLTNATMGTFNDVHTSRLFRQCVADSSLNLNGLGGELYRNRERLPTWHFDFRDWLALFIIGPEYEEVFRSKRHRAEFEDYLAEKYGKLIGVGRLAKMDRHLARRWYRDIWLPFHAGPRMCAENKVCPSLMPFADARVSLNALHATPFIGFHDELEREMIRQLDDRMAGIEFTGGKKKGENRFFYKVKVIGLSAIPVRARLYRHRVMNKYKLGKRLEGNGNLLNRFRNSTEYLGSLGLPMKVQKLLNNRNSRDHAYFIAEYLYRLRDYIDPEC